MREEKTYGKQVLNTIDNDAAGRIGKRCSMHASANTVFDCCNRSSVPTSVNFKISVHPKIIRKCSAHNQFMKTSPTSPSVDHIKRDVKRLFQFQETRG
jgi:hypothetical protein